MPDFYFERYMKQAEAAVRAEPMEAVTDDELITGIQDIGGEEARAISAALPAEGAFMARLLHAANVSPHILIEFSSEIPVHSGDKLRSGWYLGSLRHAVYMDAKGQVRSSKKAKGMLAKDGSIYAYRPQTLDTTGRLLIDGIALNRYAPVNSTTMNDRAMLYGMAILAANHAFDLRMATAL